MVNEHICTIHAAGKVRKAGEEFDADAEWRSVDAIKAAAEEPAVGFFLDMFRRQMDEVLEGLPEVWANAGGRKQLDPFAVNLLLSESWEAWLAENMPELLERIAEAGYETGKLRLSLDIPAFRASPRTQQTLSTVIGRTRRIHSTTRTELFEIIEDVLHSDGTLDDAERRIVQRFEHWQSWRARLVAQTAGTAAFETAQMDAYEAAGITRHAWLSQRDGRVRKDHLVQDASHEVVSVGTQFRIARVRFPGDPDAEDPSTVIGCRCSTLPKADFAKRLSYQGVDFSEMNERELSRVELSIRDYSIRRAYPEVRETMTQGEALSYLAEKHFCSESTVRRAIWDS